MVGQNLSRAYRPNTQKVSAGHPRIFTREEIQMHHFAYVRKDLLTKIKNSLSVQMDTGSQKQLFTSLLIIGKVKKVVL
jgi:hypothetical protein